VLSEDTHFTKSNASLDCWIGLALIISHDRVITKWKLPHDPKTSRWCRSKQTGFPRLPENQNIPQTDLVRLLKYLARPLVYLVENPKRITYFGILHKGLLTTLKSTRSEPSSSWGHLLDFTIHRIKYGHDQN
jgi:hypothetical protein